MVLNFGIIKISLYFPTRFDQYMTGPFEVEKINTEISKKMGQRKRIRKKLHKISKKRFIDIII
jgi:hypothetical protein